MPYNFKKSTQSKVGKQKQENVHNINCKLFQIIH